MFETMQPCTIVYLRRFHLLIWVLIGGWGSGDKIVGMKGAVHHVENWAPGWFRESIDVFQPAWVLGKANLGT